MELKGGSHYEYSAELFKVNVKATIIGVVDSKKFSIIVAGNGGLRNTGEFARNVIPTTACVAGCCSVANRRITKSSWKAKSGGPYV